jgi:hypothetical protein
MNIKSNNYTLVLALCFFIVACAVTGPTYTYLSEEKIRNIKKIIVIIEAENESPEILDIGGIRDETYHSLYSGGPQLYGALGVLIAGLMAETTSQYQISKALGGDQSRITATIENMDAIQIIFSGISETFNEKTKACDYINFDKIIFEENQAEKTLNKIEQEQPDNMLVIKYRYGIGVKKNYPPQPSIIATIEIYNPHNGILIEKTEISSDSTSSLYKSKENVPSLNKYSENGAALFKQDLRRVAENIGAEVARLYTYY